MGLTSSAWFFGAISIGLLILGLVFVFWPMRSARKEDEGDSPLSRKDANISLYEERVAELRSAVSLGEMKAEDAELQQAEAARHLLSDAEAEPDVKQDRAGGYWLFAVLALVLPVMSILIYLQGDGWRLINSDSTSTPWDFILHRAHESLEKNPDDLETLAFLARSYRALEKYPESAETYRHLNEVSGYSNPDFLIEEAEILAVQLEGNMRGRPTELIDKALRINPQHGRALWYGGLAALQRDDNAQAVTYWQTLSKQKLPESFRQVLTRQLERMDAAPLPMADNTQQDVIKVKVSLKPGLADELPGNTIVFVYAKATDGPGRPLAARRLQLSDLPSSVSLNNSMQMGGGPALTDFDQWHVFARLSLSGEPVAQAGDPYGVIELSKGDALQNKSLTIDSLWDH